MKSFFTVVRMALAAAGAWDRARQLAMRGRHKEALAVVDSLPPEAANTIRWRLFYLQQEYALGMDQAVVSAAPSLLADIDAAPKLSLDERRYLRGYVTWLQNRVGGLETRHILQQIDLTKVPKHWRANFPLRGHPDWAET